MSEPSGDRTHRTQRWQCYLLAPALAAVAVALIDAARTLLLGDTVVPGALPKLALVAASVGLTGPVLVLLGVVAVAAWDAFTALWRWCLRSNTRLPFEVRVAALIYAGLAVATQFFVVRAFTSARYFSFARPSFLGLAVALVAAVLALGLLLASGPAVTLLARLGVYARPRLPRFVDPGTRVGALVWVVALITAGQLLAPSLLPELRVLDLRALRLLLLWLVLLPVIVSLGRLCRGRAAIAAGIGLVLGVAASFSWAWFGLGHSNLRRVALGQYTLLARIAARNLVPFADRDGDGSPGMLQAADCDDTDPDVRPGAWDRPGDGIDQNCTGADLDLREDPLEAAPARAGSGPVPWNVIFITIDATRGDALPRLAPRIAALGDRCVSYTAAYSPGVATAWALSSVMTGKMPNRLAIGRDETAHEDEVLLGELLRDAGHHTAVISGTRSFFEGGLTQGFALVDTEVARVTRAGEVPGSNLLTDRLLDYLDRHAAGEMPSPSGRFALWGHYYDPHEPWPPAPGFPAEDESDRAAYEALVRFTDAAVGRFVDGLEARGRLADTLIVLTADHGEEVYDHGNRFHGHSLYEELVHVPLVICAPGAQARRIDTPVSNVDLMPTVLDLMGLPHPAGMHGRSRVAEVRGETLPARPVWFEVLPNDRTPLHLAGVRVGDHKLIVHADRGRFELYDLVSDSQERRDRFDTSPDAEALRALLMRYVDHQIHAMATGRSGAWPPHGAPETRPIAP